LEDTGRGVYTPPGTQAAARARERAGDLGREYICPYIVLTMRRQASPAYLPDIS
jgi:hypothetical protein